MPNDFSPLSRAGQINATGDTRALNLKVFSDEILSIFERECFLKQLTRNRRLTGAKSAQFVVIGSATAGRHTPGADVATQSIKHAEKVIAVDGLVTSAVFVPNLDEMLSHYEFRGDYARKIGSALARAYEKNIYRKLTQAARSRRIISDTYSFPGSSGGLGSSNADAVAGWDPVSGGIGAVADLRGGGAGNIAYDVNLRSATAKTSATELWSKIMYANQKFDEKNRPKQGRICLVAPAQYWLLAANGASAPYWMSRDYASGGSIETGKLPDVGGTKVLEWNGWDLDNAESTNEATSGAPHTASEQINDYRIIVQQDNDGATTYVPTGVNNQAALVFHEDAVASVQVADMALESEYQIRNQGTLMVAKYVTGHDVLEPSAACEITGGTMFN
jgi:hypothetical protein